MAGAAIIAVSPITPVLPDVHLPTLVIAGQFDTVTAVSHGELIAQAMINLIENALRHTPAGTKILIGARQEFGGAMAFVRDSGPGIPESERERVLERFVRLEEARSTPGHGLGLSLVRAIAHAHDAPISMTARDGFEITLHFPAGRAA